MGQGNNGRNQISETKNFSRPSANQSPHDLHDEAVRAYRGISDFPKGDRTNWM